MSKGDFETLAHFRYQLRRYLRFSEDLTQRAGITPLQYLLMLQIKGFPGRESANVGELAGQTVHHIHFHVLSGKQLGSFNLLWAAVHEWVGIAKDVWHAPWRHKLSYMWREPGWSHDDSRQTSEMIREKWQAGRPAEEAAE